MDDILTAEERLKGYIASLDARIVARGGTSIYAPRPAGELHVVEEWKFAWWEKEKLDAKPLKGDPDDGFYRRVSVRGKLHLVRKP